MHTREDRIRARAHWLWEEEGRPERPEHEYRERAAGLIDEEDRQSARSNAEPLNARAPDMIADQHGNDPISVTLSAMRRQG